MCVCVCVWNWLCRDIYVSSVDNYVDDNANMATKIENRSSMFLFLLPLFCLLLLWIVCFNYCTYSNVSADILLLVSDCVMSCFIIF